MKLLIILLVCGLVGIPVTSVDTPVVCSPYQSTLRIPLSTDRLKKALIEGFTEEELLEYYSGDREKMVENHSQFKRLQKKKEIDLVIEEIKKHNHTGERLKAYMKGLRHNI